MKSLIAAGTLAVVFSAPALCFAQQASNEPLTRAQVRQDLVDLESVGYNPFGSGDATQYPKAIQNAGNRLATKRLAAAKNAQSTYGPDSTGSSESGNPAR
ncbi:hypothetical protein CY652_07535 [Burkholderia sp. WAC0059]|uniref:DUF4148 domain-containing protein n=1 Tax=Burkholderia sp. WAC0059 TaxID=2066022 RepID=UPI000C7F5295|nr:DUF4148 domain-containing protein [Burkholderia sp. WAC0059]PLZ03206.1 hypothetical protein CY652_07535 [Burkholderia sp. WAC0059]